MGESDKGKLRQVLYDYMAFCGFDSESKDMGNDEFENLKKRYYIEGSKSSIFRKTYNYSSRALFPRSMLNAMGKGFVALVRAPKNIEKADVIEKAEADAAWAKKRLIIHMIINFPIIRQVTGGLSLLSDFFYAKQRRCYDYWNDKLGNPILARAITVLNFFCPLLHSAWDVFLHYCNMKNLYRDHARTRTKPAKAILKGMLAVVVSGFGFFPALPDFVRMIFEDVRLLVGAAIFFPLYGPYSLGKRVLQSIGPSKNTLPSSEKQSNQLERKQDGSISNVVNNGNSLRTSKEREALIFGQVGRKSTNSNDKGNKHHNGSPRITH